MADPTDLLVGGGAGTLVGGLIIGLLKWSGSRNISALDKTLSELASAVNNLREEVQRLREAHVGLVKDIGSLQRDNELLRERVDKLAEHWREEFEQHRALVHDRMTQATHAMIEAGDNGKGKRK